MKSVAGPPWVLVARYAMQTDRVVEGILIKGVGDRVVRDTVYRSVRWWDDEIKEKIDLLGQTPPQRVAGKSSTYWTITQRCLQRGKHNAAF